MKSFRVDPSAHTPPSVQIVDAVLDALVAGLYGPGEKLPSVRSLAVNVLVNPNTVAKAYAALERSGVTEGRNGSGVFVTPDGPERAIALRSEATLAAFHAAARAALRAGHGLEVLVANLADAATAPALEPEQELPHDVSLPATDAPATTGATKTDSAATKRPAEKEKPRL